MPEILIPTLDEPGLSDPELHTPTPRKRRSWLTFALLAAAAVLFGLHFVHLRADFPNYSEWKDWAKYTDEGWYGDAAIRHYLLGHWNVPGDFNPAAALPVWPALELVLFRFTGVSLVAARVLSLCVFGLTLLAMYLLIRLWQTPAETAAPPKPLAASLTVLLLAASPFCFVFARLAILEPLLVLLTVLALIAATLAGRANTRPGSILWPIALGALLPLAILTKTTAVFLFPAVGWMLFAACGLRLRRFLRIGLIAGATAAVLWGGYYGLFVRPHFLTDYKYLFSANQYTGFTWATLPGLLFDTLKDAVWIGLPTFALSLAALLWAAVRTGTSPRTRGALPGAFYLWVLGYGAFLTYHANLQPRYYLVVAPPLTALVALAFDDLRVQLRRLAPTPRLAVLATAVAALAFTVGRAASHTIHFAFNPQFTWVTAVHRVQDEIETAARKGHPRLVLSISGSDITLMTGIPSICDDFGSANLPDRVARYRPGWFATWNDVEDDKMEALAPLYRLERVAAIPAFDDPDRNLLILYRLDPRETPEKPTHGRRRRPVWVPRSLRTPISEPPVTNPSTH